MPKLDFIFLNDLNSEEFKTDNSLNVLNDLSNINVFIGENNSGKSRFIRSICLKMPKIYSKYASLRNDFANRVLENSFITLNNKLDKPKYLSVVKGLDRKGHSDFSMFVSDLIQYDDGAEFQPTMPILRETEKANSEITTYINELRENRKFTDEFHEGLSAFYIPVLRGLKPLINNNNNNKISYDYSDIYSNRTKDDYGNDLIVYSGLNIFEDIKKRLLGEEHERKLIADFENFIGEYIFKEKITLIPKYGDDILHIKIGNNPQRSISNLGDGLQSLLIIFYPIFIHKDDLSFFFIEEPETHLHPKYQKLLISLLLDMSDRHQYFFTTHSNSFINDQNCSIFSVNKENDISIIKHLNSNNQKWETLSELGYKASDLLQTNFIIWVEGPADKIYIKYLLNKIAPELKEYIHFTIMFYYGTSSKYLFEEDLDKSLILSLNRNFAYICDSDKLSEECKSKKYLAASELIKKLTNADIYAWMTPFREFENHIDSKLFLEAIKKIINDDSAEFISDDSYGDRYLVQTKEKNKSPKINIRLTNALLDEIKRSKNIVENIKDDFLKNEIQKSIDSTIDRVKQKVDDKVAIAEYIVKNGFKPDEHLEKMIKELLDKIKLANHIL